MATTEITDTIRKRVADALKDARKSLKYDVWPAVIRSGHEVSYPMVCAVARGSALGDGQKDSPKADAVRAAIASLTGKTVEWLFMTKENGNVITIDRSGSGGGAT